MKVCFLGRYNTEEILTGPEKVAKRIYTEMKGRGHELMFVEYFYDGSTSTVVEKLFGHEIINDSMNGSSIHRVGIVPLIWLLFKQRPDVVNVITFERAAVVSILPVMLRRTKLVYFVHGVVAYENEFPGRNVSGFLRWKDARCESMFFRFANRVVFPSDRLVDLASRLYGIRPERIKIIPLGADASFFREGEGRQRKKGRTPALVFPADSRRVQKGFDFLEEALGLLRHRVRLYVVGPGAPTRIVRNKWVDLIVVPQMSTNRLAAFYADKDVILSTSWYDNFPLATLEGMAAGLTPVLTEETGTSSYLENGRNGFTFKFGDREALAGIIARLATHPRLRATVGRRARETARELTWAKTAERLEGLFKTLAR